MAVVKRALFALVSFVLAALCVLALFPFGVRAGAAQEEYLCRWEDGSVTRERYAAAYADFADCSEEVIRLYRAGLTGEITPAAQYTQLVNNLYSFGLAELLTLEVPPLARLERLAFWRAAAKRVWYSGGCFVWNGAGLEEADSATGETLVLLSGSISAAALAASGATTLELRSEATFDAATLVGTHIERVTAHAPYSFEGGAVYLDTTARRLVAGVPALTCLRIENCDYIDEGALRACARLQSLTLPFAGDTRSGAESGFHGELAYLFQSGSEYTVPESLKRVAVTGGVLVSHAFYRLEGVEEIELCGMSPENIACDALADCKNLKRLHAPASEFLLHGNYSVTTAPCGCSIFERIE